MRLVIGGYAQGKLRYAVNRYGPERESCDIWDGEIPDRIEKTEGRTVILDHFHNWVKGRILQGGCPEEEIRTFIDQCPRCVIISDEIGNGIVPTEAVEREYRERTGRILVELAERAEEVVRVICGIGQKIK